MKKDNEAKMKEILNELEDELLDEEVDNKKEEVVEEKEKETVVEEETVPTEEDKKEDSKDEDKEENEEESSTEEIEDKVVEESKEETVEEEIKEDKKEEETTVVEDDDKDLEVKESPIRQVGNYLIEKLKKYKYVLILDLAVFLFLFFVVPMVILEVKPVVWMTLFLIFTILPTVAFYLKKLFKKYQIMVGIPFFYLCILCILDSCTIKDLYGITSHGALDKTPAWVDAILVTFIIVFFQYIGLTVMDVAKKYLKCNKKK